MAKGREPNSGKKIPRKPTPVMEGSAKDDSSGGEHAVDVVHFDDFYLNLNSIVKHILDHNPYRRLTLDIMYN